MVVCFNDPRIVDGHKSNFNYLSKRPVATKLNGRKALPKEYTFSLLNQMPIERFPKASRLISSQKLASIPSIHAFLLYNYVSVDIRLV